MAEPVEFYDPRLDELADRGADGLAAVLRRRPDVTEPPPHSLAELAARLDHPYAVHQFLRGLPLPFWQVFAAACALDSLPLEEFRRRFAVDPLPQLRVLHEAALLELDERDDHLAVPDEIVVGQPDPLHLGPNLLVIAAEVPAEFVRAAARAFGCGPTSTGHESLFALAEAYLDGDRVRRALDGLPEDLVATLVGIAAEHDLDPEFGVVPRRYPDHLLRAATAIGRQRGVIIAIDDHPDSMGVMPAEVRLALRGPGYRLPCEPEPAVAWLPLARAEQDAAAAMRSFDAATTAVLDDIDRHGLTLLKAGGVGTRELKRLAKTTQLQEATVWLVLELASEAGLLDAAGSRARTADGYRAWRDAEPARRHVEIVRAWWRFPGRPTESRDRHGFSGRPLLSVPCQDCRLEHVSLLSVLRPEAGLARDDAAQLASWTRPAAHLSGEPYASAWAEATELGVVAQGALTDVGTALLAGDDDAVLTACAAALPAATGTAVFGSDLTALAIGSPSGRVSRVLDACADRESTGGAVTWRLSRGSVRRALDDGWSMPELRAGLAEIAGDASLPPAVTVLLDDVDRAYGRMVVHAATCVLVAEDELVAAELLHDRRLAGLGFAAITPTVLTSATGADAVVAALRKAGHLPRYDVVAASPAPTSPTPVRVGRPRPAPVASPSGEDVDFRDLAERLLRAPRRPLPSPRPYAEPSRPATSELTLFEADTLRAAVEFGSRVEIVYQDGQGSITERTIRPAELAGGMIRAWCELRSAEREFVVGRILAVRPV